MTVMKTRAKSEWTIAFNSMSQKHAFYWEAFEEMIKMVNKEINMGCPRDRMHQQKVWEYKEKAVNNIMKRLKSIMLGNVRGQEVMHIQRFIANEISEAQNF